MLSSEFDSFSDEEKKEFLSKISLSAKRIVETMDQFTDLGEQLSLGRALKKEKLNLKDAINKVVDSLSFEAETKKISLSVSVDKRVFLSVDKLMFFGIIRNLLANAIKFQAGGMVKIAVEQSHGLIYIHIMNSGTFIPEENIKRLFLRFDGKSTPDTDGKTSTGLGLMLVKEFVELNGGGISVMSKPEVGTTFTVMFPVP